MATEIDLTKVMPVVKEAYELMEAELQSQAISGKLGRAEAILIAETAINMVLKAFGEKPHAPTHVKVKVDDLNGQMTRFAFDMQPLTDLGDTIIDLLGGHLYDPEKESGAMN